MVNKFKNTNGYVSIYVIVILAILIPFMFFLTIDLPYYMRMNRTVKNAVDNATSTAITYLDESAISSGNLVINENEARRIVKKVIKEYFYLNDDLTVNENSLIPNTPTINIEIINNPTGQIVYTQNGGTKINNPSVVVYVEIPVEGKFFKVTKSIKHTAVSQVKFSN